MKIQCHDAVPNLFKKRMKSRKLLDYSVPSPLTFHVTIIHLINTKMCSRLASMHMYIIYFS